jgi:hypothetical protein
MTKHVHSSAGDHTLVVGRLVARQEGFTGQTFELALGTATGPPLTGWLAPDLDEEISPTERRLGLMVGDGALTDPPAKAYTLWCRVASVLEVESVPAVNDKVVID